MEDIEFTEVEDVRGTGMHILVGKNSTGKTWHAVYRNNKRKAEDAIRKRFADDAKQAPFTGSDNEHW